MRARTRPGEEDVWADNAPGDDVSGDEEKAARWRSRGERFRRELEDRASLEIEHRRSRVRDASNEGDDALKEGGHPG
jgi:hypothetical protein